ncbi:ALQxL family class IV lanthipeptide [Nonomuraea candida]|nr:ALQxL family class IV lanthipeptide [Nonomuraea candida]
MELDINALDMLPAAQESELYPCVSTWLCDWTCYATFTS